MNAAVQSRQRADVEAPAGGPDRYALEQIVARSSEGVLLIDALATDLPVVYANPAFEALTGYSIDAIVGGPWHVLGTGADAGPGVERLRSAIAAREAVEVVLEDERKDGSVWQSRVSLSPLHDARGEIRHFLVLQREAAAGTSSEQGNVEIRLLRNELGRARQKIDTMNKTDPVTGLLRYEHFVDVLNRDLAVARRERRPVTVMMFDIVELDVYRNTFGSKAAESCVRMIAAQISGTMRRAGDLCARCDDTLIAASVLGQEAAHADVLVNKIVANVRGLKLHNPRAKSGRYVGVAAASTGGVPGPSDDAQTLIDRVKSELLAKG
jgi:two-component system, cell cycle response regulator